MSFLASAFWTRWQRLLSAWRRSACLETFLALDSSTSPAAVMASANLVILTSFATDNIGSRFPLLFILKENRSDNNTECPIRNNQTVIVKGRTRYYWTSLFNRNIVSGSGSSDKLEDLTTFSIFIPNWLEKCEKRARMAQNHLSPLELEPGWQRLMW